MSLLWTIHHPQKNNKKPNQTEDDTMKIKRKPLTPEQQRELDENWEAIGKLRISPITGMILTPEEYEQEQQQYKVILEERQRISEQRENVNTWNRLDFETLNTLIIKYKETGNQLYFEQAWDNYLWDLNHSLIEKYLIKGLPTIAKQLFLDGNNYSELKDEFYIVLIETINKWTPNSPDHYTRDFAAFYQQAIYDYVGGYKTRLKRPKYSQVTGITPVDFNNQQEVAMITQLSNIGKHFNVESETNYILMDIHIETFIKTKLTKEQSMLLGLLVTERLPITEIAKYMKTSRMTVYRKIEELKTLWQQYEEGSN